MLILKTRIYLSIGMYVG
jgi:hypothetical protein